MRMGRLPGRLAHSPLDAQTKTGRLELRGRRPEVAVRDAGVVARRSELAAAQHALVVHELAVVLHQRAGERTVSGVGLVVAGGPLPAVARELAQAAARRRGQDVE